MVASWTAEEFVKDAQRLTRQLGRAIESEARCAVSALLWNVRHHELLRIGSVGGVAYRVHGIDCTLTLGDVTLDLDVAPDRRHMFNSSRLGSWALETRHLRVSERVIEEALAASARKGGLFVVHPGWYSWSPEPDQPLN